MNDDVMSDQVGTTRHRQTGLPAWARTLVVVAHPDDESFGLGAVIDAFARAGSAVHVLCLTRGEASTLGADLADLGEVRRRELEQAGAVLGIRSSSLLSFPDGGLADVPVADVDDAVHRAVDDHRPDGLLVFDPNGITGHPDHQAATEAAARVGRKQELPILAWTLPTSVAEQLNAEFGAGFQGHPTEDCQITLPCDRTRQLVAVRAHASQAVPGSPLWRRLELLGTTEWLRTL